jgi:hypothetical protein
MEMHTLQPHMETKKQTKANSLPKMQNTVLEQTKKSYGFAS